MNGQPQADDFADIAKPVPKASGDDFADIAQPAAHRGGFAANPSGEGAYTMLDKSGKGLKVPYSTVGRAAQAGYTMQAEERGRFVEDAAADPHLARLFPGLKLPEGVRIAGLNSAGQPILAPVGTPPSGSAGKRFGSSLWEQWKGPVAGTYHALKEGPQTPEEARFQAATDPVAMRLKRVLVDPSIEQARKAGEEFGQSGNWLSPTEEQAWHQMLAVGHTLATIPLIGPAAAQIGEKLGTQLGSGDYAGAAGTLTGAAALEAAPKLGSKALRSEFVTRTLPRGTITRLIKPMKGDLTFGKEPAAAILGEGITGNSLEQLGDKVYGKLHEVGKAIDAKAQSPEFAGKVVDVTAALQPLDDAMAKAAKASDPALFSKLVAAKGELTSHYRPFRSAQGEITLRRVGPRNLKMSPAEALEFKRSLGDRIRWNDDPLDGEVNKALGAAYGKVSDSVNAAVPGLADLNNRYSNLVGAAKAVERRIPVEQRSSHWSLSDVTLGTHSLPLAIARKAAEHPGFRTRWAQAAHRLPTVVPELPLIKAAPVVGVLQSQQTLEQLREQAKKRNPHRSPSVAAP